MAPRPLPPMDIRSRSQQYTERTAGVHFSDIMQDLLVSMDPETYGRNEEGDIVDEGKWLNFLIGLIFERAIEMAWMDRELEGQYRPGLVRPGELWTPEGVIITPDMFDTELNRPVEFKCSKKSCRQGPDDPKFWHYWVQLKAQARALGVNEGELWILHINGDYGFLNNRMTPESGYVLKGWVDTWTDQQLDDNWAMLINHATHRGMLRAA